jgi:dolichyl-phosphate-mannose--protein O-mannosyl transferase
LFVENAMGSDQRAQVWSRQDWVAIAGVTIAAGLVRFVRLAEPGVLVFNEEFYVQDACRYLLGAADVCLNWAPPIPESHPPLAKWLIAAGISAFGYTPLGWRVATAAAGTLTVALLYLLARKLSFSAAGATLAAFLLAIDPLHFLHSRLGMLDIFIPLFATAALLCCVYDRDHILRRRSNHPWRLAAGIAAGAAIAVKWPGAFALATVVFLTVRWELSARRTTGVAAVREVFREQGLSIAGALLLLPALVYAASYTWTRPTTLFTARFWSELARYHAFLWQIHGSLGGLPAQSPPWTWFLPTRPMVYFHQYAEEGCREVAAFASPLWVLALVPIGLMLVRAAQRHRVEDAEGMILCGFACSYLPWLLVALNRSVIFLYYMLPTVPFFCLAMAHLARSMPRAVAVWVLLSVVFFAFFYPRLTALAHLERLPVHEQACIGLVYPP